MITSLLNAILALPAGPKILTIDGSAGAGKTTLAENLRIELDQRLTSVGVIHMDDLYNGWGDALTQSLTNTLVDLIAQHSHGSIRYNVFDWDKNTFVQVRELNTPDILILEGVGSGQRSIRHAVNLAIWIDAQPEIAFERVINRDGEKIRPFLNDWVSAQSAHFAAEDTKGAADYVFNGAP